MMNVGRLMSLAVFVLVVGAMRWLAPQDVWAQRPGIVVSAMVVAAGVAVVHWCLFRVLVERPLGQLRRRVHSLPRDSPGSTHLPQIGSGDLAGAIEQTVATLRQRLTELDHALDHERRRAEIAEAACHRLEAVLRTISDGVIVTDAEDRVMLANDAAARALGFSSADVRLHPLEQIVDEPALVRLIQETRIVGEPHALRRVEQTLGARGLNRRYELSLICARGAGREVCGVVTVLRDVTRQQELAAMNTDLICGVSHELRTPLSSIGAYAEMLLDDEVRDENTRREFYTIIQSEAQRLARLIESVLNISRIESGMLQVQRERVNLGTLVRDAMEVIHPQASGKSIDFHQRTRGTVCVYADRDMIHQSVLNLLSNAVKYTLPGGSVCIEVFADEPAGVATIQVSDTGVGIPDEAKPRLFEKFAHVGEHRKLAPGTGLGLNLVKQIVETVHHGTVSVRSRVGHGSTFTINLPLLNSGQDTGDPRKQSLIRRAS